jgi:hypothetical protein
MWRTLLQALVLIALLAGGQATLVAAAEAPRCAGSDLLEKARREEPAEFAAATAAAQEIAAGDHLLWRIEGRDGGASSYLFGTIHYSDDRLAAVVETIAPALGAARTVALELSDMPKPEAVHELLRKRPELVAMPEGRSMWELLRPESAEAAKAMLAATGIDPARLDALQPWLVAVLLALPPCEQKRQAAGLLPVDGLVMQAARKKGIPIVGLETLAEQLGAMAAMPLEAQAAFLVSVASEEATPEDNYETMVNLYLGRRVAMMFPLMDLAMKEKPEIAAGVRHLSEALIASRNAVMVERALPLIEQGGAFIAVGALHLPGRQGLVELLRTKGYRVSPAD